jgi:hypothetical protein
VHCTTLNGTGRATGFPTRALACQCSHHSSNHPTAARAEGASAAAGAAWPFCWQDPPPRGLLTLITQPLIILKAPGSTAQLAPLPEQLPPLPGPLPPLPGPLPSRASLVAALAGALGLWRAAQVRVHVRLEHAHVRQPVAQREPRSLGSWPKRDVTRMTKKPVARRADMRRLGPRKRSMRRAGVVGARAHAYGGGADSGASAEVPERGLPQACSPADEPCRP